ncbi:hypothetical protein B0H12DRAFT_587684 [Mycena haematopus]|nr:hypothetical protein B0H12DRAFT_587684 [Mycena haematopus]
MPPRIRQMRCFPRRELRYPDKTIAMQNENTERSRNRCLNVCVFHLLPCLAYLVLQQYALQQRGYSGRTVRFSRKIDLEMYNIYSDADSKLKIVLGNTSSLHSLVVSVCHARKSSSYIRGFFAIDLLGRAGCITCYTHFDGLPFRQQAFRTSLLRKMWTLTHLSVYQHMWRRWTFFCPKRLCYCSSLELDFVVPPMKTPTIDGSVFQLGRLGTSALRDIRWSPYRATN